jgi:small neutral amino acid transporter SnatA (MarC family)
VSAVVALLVALDPLGLARTWPRRAVVAAVVGAVLVLAAVLADTVLDVLDLSPEGFWISAGIVLLVPAFGRLGRSTTHDVAGPGAVLVTMALATRDGVTTTLVAVAVSVVAVLAATTFVRPDARWLGIAQRVVGALMVVVAFDLVRDGVIAV